MKKPRLAVGASTNLHTFAEYSDNTAAEVSYLANTTSVANAFTLRFFGEPGAKTTVTGVAAAQGAVNVVYGSGGVALDVTVE